MFGILSYVVAELLDMSGVITVLISGVGLAHYNFYNLDVGGMHATAYNIHNLELASSPFRLLLRPLFLSIWVYLQYTI
jgi:hypothetical protein